MKKFLALALALVLAFALVACGGGGDTSTGFKVDIFYYDFADPYLTSVRDAMTEILDAKDGIEYQYHDAKNDQATQSEQIETAISTGTKLLVVNQVTTGSEEVSQNIIKLAKDKNIPVVFFNREIATSALNAYEGSAVFVGTDADEAGVLQGELIAEILLADYEKYDLNGDGNISYIMFKGELQNPEANGRTKYAVEVANEKLVEAGKPELVYYDPDNTDLFQGCNWKAAESQPEMASALGKYPMDGKNPIELVITNNDDMAEGAISALNEVGYNTGDGPSIPVFGVDATAAARALIEAGKMTGTILQDAVAMAQGVVDFIVAAKDGKAFADVLSTFKRVDEDVKVRIPYAKVK